MQKTLQGIRELFFRIPSWLHNQHERRPRAFLILLCSTALLVFATYSILRQLALQTTFFDLGLYSSSIWKTTHGYDSWASLMFPSPAPHIGHFSPILGLVALVFFVLPDPKTLLVIQSAVLAASAVPLYLLALRETGRAKLSLLVSGVYLLNPGLHGVVRYDFHVEAFVPLFIFLVYYLRSKANYPLFSGALALLLTTVEFSAVIGIGIAIGLLLERRRIDRFVMTAVVPSGILLALFLASDLIPAGLLGWHSNWLTGQLQESTPASSLGFLGVLERPGLVLSLIGHDIVSKLLYLLLILAPTCLFVLKYPLRMLPSLPWIAVVLVSQRPGFVSVDYQYSVFIIPFAYLAIIPILGRASTLRLARAILASAIVFLLLASALSPTRPVILTPYPQTNWAAPSPALGTLNFIHDSLPVNATVLTQNDIFPQISDRPFATINYSMPYPPEFILVKKDSPWYDWSAPSLGIPFSAHQQFDRFAKNYSYELAVSDQGLTLYRLLT